MKHPLAFCLALISTAAALRSADVPEFDRLRANYLAAIDRVTRPLTQSYLIDLERQRDAYARASKLEAANAVQAEIDVIKQAIATAETAKKLPLNSPTNKETNAAPQLHWFAGKTWLTDAKTKWTFNRNGTGEKVRGNDKIATFMWKLLPSGNLELTERSAPDKPVATSYVQFKGRSEAWFGTSEAKLDNRLHTE